MSKRKPKFQVGDHIIPIPGGFQHWVQDGQTYKVLEVTSENKARAHSTAPTYFVTVESNGKRTIIWEGCFEKTDFRQIIPDYTGMEIPVEPITGATGMQSDLYTPIGKPADY